jgi:hypothetical protein
VHAQCRRDVVRSHLDDPEGFVREWDDVTERQVAPFYWAQPATIPGPDRAELLDLLA